MKLETKQDLKRWFMPFFVFLLSAMFYTLVFIFKKGEMDNFTLIKANILIFSGIMLSFTLALANIIEEKG